SWPWRLCHREILIVLRFSPGSRHRELWKTARNAVRHGVAPEVPYWVIGAISGADSTAAAFSGDSIGDSGACSGDLSRDCEGDSGPGSASPGTRRTSCISQGEGAARPADSSV